MATELLMILSIDRFDEVEEDMVYLMHVLDLLRILLKGMYPTI